MAKKDVNIVTSLVGKGLEREYLLLRELLLAHDCYTVGIHYTDFARATLVRADVTICLEVVMPNALHLSRENWLVPNSEWWYAVNDRFLPQFTKVLCKTQDCYRIWCEKVGAGRCTYLGFEARDLYRPDVPRENKILHLAGESEFKNTEAVVLAWRDQMSNNISQRPSLTVVTRQKKFQDLCEGVPDVTCIPRVTEEQLIELMNSHRFHLLPSAYEGFGHALNEGIGCGALVITTDAAPMNEFDGVVKDWAIPVVRREPRSLAQLNYVDDVGVFKAIRRVVGFFNEPAILEQRAIEARKAFLASRAAFRQKFLTLVGV